MPRLARRQNLLWVSKALRLEAVGDPRPAIVRDERQPIDRAVSRQHLGVEAETAIQVRGALIQLPLGAYATRQARGRRQDLDQTGVANYAARMKAEARLRPDQSKGDDSPD